MRHEEELDRINDTLLKEGLLFVVVFIENHSFKSEVRCFSSAPIDNVLSVMDGITRNTSLIRPSTHINGIIVEPTNKKLCDMAEWISEEMSISPFIGISIGGGEFSAFGMGLSSEIVHMACFVTHNILYVKPHLDCKNHKPSLN